MNGCSLFLWAVWSSVKKAVWSSAEKGGLACRKGLGSLVLLFMESMERQALMALSRALEKIMHRSKSSITSFAGRSREISVHNLF